MKAEGQIRVMYLQARPGTPRTVSKPLKLGEQRGSCSLSGSNRKQLCQNLDFGLAASRTVSPSHQFVMAALGNAYVLQAADFS